ncbi:MAG: ATP-binding cassette domain-containing protein [bacterium]|nr:ATP-binding cassette domain-containing protein [bacterium]
MLTIKNIYKSYGKKDNKYPALKDISLSFRPSEFVAILGPSGSGKTTLLNILGGLDHYDAGDLIINGESTKKFKDKDWDSYRNKSIGFIFQSYNLISHISILSNVEMCLTLRNLSKSEAKKRAIEALERVGLIDHLHKKPNELSGGQMQRVAIARALVNNPDIILADEPTGALDSKTSTQIMELIKDISKEKLVIMVTHNEELANIYANRIIKLSDGVIVSDSNPYSKEEQDSTYTLPKTKMSVLTALGLSLNNIKTKKGRTLLTSFAASIGIIGISLVLALSNGFQKQIDKFERETLANMPIYIMPEATSFQDELNTAFDMTEEEEYPTDNKIRSYTTDTASYHTNIITDEYLEYIKKLDDKYINGIGYGYRTNMNVLVKNNKVEKFPNYFLDSNLIGEASLDILIENYDLLEGKYPENKNEVILLVDTYNRLSTNLYKALGLSSNNTFADICGKELKIVNNNYYYQEAGNIFLENNDYSSLWDNQNNVSIKITGVIRTKKDATAAIYDESSILTYNELLEDFINNNINSEIIVKQKNSNSNVLTDLEFENDSEKEEAIRSLGGNKIPASIAIYPNDFTSKDEILTYLDKYNETKEEKDKIIYTDYAKTMTELSSGIMNGITLVLIGFSSVSLVVSSIMISIITYISVLERTKEIGILRSLGARKKDISRVFNAETTIIGFISGLLGVLIAYILTFPINIIIENATKLNNVASLSPTHAILMISISIIITVIGGLIPAKMASKKDPVVALRTE